MSGIWKLGKIWWINCSSYIILCRWTMAFCRTHHILYMNIYFKRADVHNLIYSSKWTKLIISSRRRSFALFIPNCGALTRRSMRYCSIIEFGETSVETIHRQFCIRNLDTLKLGSVLWEFEGDEVVYVFNETTWSACLKTKIMRTCAF